MELREIEWFAASEKNRKTAEHIASMLNGFSWYDVQDILQGVFSICLFRAFIKISE